MNESAVQLQLNVDASTKDKWEKMLDLIVGIFNIPCALVMHVLSNEIEVFARSTNPDNIYQIGQKAQLGTGLYSETVIQTREMLNISNALNQSKWENNPDIAYSMISYLGVPILWPNKDVFGTVCILDKRERIFTDSEMNMLIHIATVIGDSLKALLDCEKLNLDVELQSKAALALRESEERFRKVFGLSPSAIMITTADEGRFVDVNDACLKLFGVNKQELLGKKVTDFPMYGDPGERDVVVEKLRQHGKIWHHFSYKKTSKGDDLELDVSVDIIRIGEKDCLISTLFDLTEQNRLERQLKAVNERLILAADSAGIGIWDWDLRNDLLEWDKNMYRLYQAEDVAVNYQVWRSRVHPEDRECFEHDLNEALLDGSLYTSQFRLLLPEGELRILQAYGRVIRDSSGVPVRMLGVNLDVTEKVRAQAKLENGETRLRRAQRMACVGNWELDVTKGEFWASEEAFRIYGFEYTSPIIKAGVAQNAVLAEDRAMMDAALRGGLIGAPYDVQFRIQRMNDGAVRILHSVAEMEVHPDDGRPIIKGVVHDITDYVHAEQRLIESERRYKSLFDDSSAVHLVIEKQTGGIFAANAAAAAFYGYTADQLTSMKVTDLNGLPLPAALNNLRLAYSGERSYYEIVHRIADGDFRHIAAFGGPIDLDGKEYVQYVVYDITERKRAEKALTESELRFRQFVENAPDGVFVETGGRFVYVNTKTVQMFGAASEEELIDKDVLSVFAEEYRKSIRGRMWDLNVRKVPVPLRDEAIIRQDGSRLNVEVSAVPFRYQEQDSALVFMRDISERKQMEREKETMEAQLQQKQKLEAIGTLAGGVAHEINNPVTGIINYAQLISESSAADDEIRNFCSEIVHEGRRIAEIVSSLLKFSRQEKKTHSPAQISDIVMGTLSLTRTILRHDQIALEVNIPNDLPSVKCRSQQIQQVLMNLITNARDALNAKYKGFDENKKITISSGMFEREGRRWLRVTVEDSGTGIPPDVMEKIFNPFFTTKPRDEGTGLGLSISHGIVREHHGELYFETSVGEFTRAVLELPIDNGWDIE